MNHFLLTFLILITLMDPSPLLAQESEKNTGLQLSTNPPMEVIARTPPPVPVVSDQFEIRPGFTLIDSLDDFRLAIKKNSQKIRLKPGIYRATKVDPPIDLPLKRSTGIGRARDKGRQEHIFAVTGSHNSFDLRGVVIETPVSLQSRLSRRPHVSDCWHINGTQNVFIGGYFRNIIDRPYPNYHVANNEFEICGDGNRFFDCTFVIQGSIPYGYTDFYGKGSDNYGRLNKHSFMSINHANDTQLIRCKVFQQSFGHCLHFHTVDGVTIKNCAFTGALRPTNDIFKEVEGRAVDYDFLMKYRREQPIPRDLIIPLVEDGIRSYDNVRNITITDTTVERMRGAIQLHCEGNLILKNVAVQQAGDFSFDVSTGDKGKVLLENCRSDLSYNPIFNLMRGPVPENARYEVAITDPPQGATPTKRTSLGIITGDKCHFVLTDRTTRPLPKEVLVLECGGHRRDLTHSTIENHTKAKIILNKNVRNCTIKSLGPVEDQGENNTIIPLT